MNITIDQAIDVGYATFPNIKKDALQMTFNDVSMEAYNNFFREAERGSGDWLKGYTTLEDTGNGKHITLWEEDSENAVNTDHEVTVRWSNYTTNLSYNRIELGMNMGDEVRVYRYLEGKMKNMYREAAEDLQNAIFGAPTSSSDKVNPNGIPCWLSYGTDDSTGGFTGEYGHYNDGSGTSFNVGNINGNTYPRWASYYADHNGELGDNLVSLLDGATISTHFMPPMIPNKVAEETNFGNFRFYTNKNVITNLNALLLKSDDNVGPDLGKYHGMTVYKGIPFIYVQQLDTANTSTYGTDPLFGVNFDFLRCVVLKENDFVIGKPYPRDAQHNVLKVTMDLSYGIISENRQRAGFLINQQ